MELHDQHLHSWNSVDCKTPPPQNVERAIQIGLSGLTFTEHFDTHPSEWDDCVYNDAKIETELAELRERYGREIFIGKGIEVCYQPEKMNFILDFLSKHTFDVVIVSLHWAGGKPIHERRHFAQMTLDQYIEHYLHALRDAAVEIARMKKKGRQPFHVLGHMDFARRYAHGWYGYDGPIQRLDLIDEILTHCLEADLIPEINTSTLRNGMSAPMPGPEVVERYAALGGTMMSLGSDAHSPQYVGAHFDHAVNMLRDAGIKQLAVYKGGRLEPGTLGWHGSVC